MTDNKIYLTLKSIFRYTQLQEMKAPQVLFETEEKLMKNRLSSLSCEEIVKLVKAWPDFLKEQMVEDAKQNQALERDLEKFLHNLN